MTDAQVKEIVDALRKTTEAIVELHASVKKADGRIESVARDVSECVNMLIAVENSFRGR